MRSVRPQPSDFIAILAAVALLWPGRAEAGAWVIPPGREAEIQAFVAPMVLGQDTATGQRFDGLSIDRDHLVLRFLDGAKTPLVIELRHPEEAKDGELAGAVAVRAAGDVPEPLLALVRGVFVGKSAEELPWSAAATTTTAVVEAPARGGPPPAVLLGAMWGLLAALLLLTGRLAWERRGRAGRGAWAALGALTVAAAAIRIGLSPRAFLHEFYHIADYVQDDLFNESGPFLYGAAGPALHRLANGMLGGDEQAVFSANTVLASLTVPAVAMLDLALFGRWPRALVAGALFALLPVHVRFSASEEFTIAAVLFATWGAAAFVEWVRSRSRLALGVAVAAFALAANTRPEFVLMPALAALALFLLRPAEWRRAVSVEALVAALALAGLAGPRWFTLVAGEAGFAPDLALAWGALPTLTTFLDASITPRSYVALTTVGLAWGAWRARGAHLWLLGCAAVWVVISLAYFQNPAPYSWRTQLVAMPFLVVAAASAWSMAAELVARPWALGGVAAALVLPAIAGLAARAEVVGELADQQLEFAYLSENTGTLPDEGRLLTVAQPGGRNLDAFPHFLLVRAGKRFELVDLDSARKGTWPVPGGPTGPLIFYQGMYCWFGFADEPAPVPMAERCAAVHRRYVLEELNVQSISARPYSRLEYHPGPYLLGFYKVVGVRAPEPGQVGVAP